jgi:hypothetical protein
MLICEIAMFLLHAADQFPHPDRFITEVAHPVDGLGSL